jgi:hypothetical protein
MLELLKGVVGKREDFCSVEPVEKNRKSRCRYHKGLLAKLTKNLDFFCDL